MKKGTYMAINQYGDTVHGLECPARDLMRDRGKGKARKMYVDGKDGKNYHIGYVIGQEWFTVYEVSPVRIAE